MKDNDRKATCYNNWNTLNTQHVQPQSRYYSSLIPQETEATIRQRLTKDKTTEDWKNAARSDESLVLLLNSDGRVRTWSKQHKGMDLLPRINFSGWWWRCSGVEDIFLAHFCLFSTN